MKSATTIDNYFGQGCKRNKSVITSTSTHCDISENKCLTGEISTPTVDALSGKENMHDTVEGKDPSHPNEVSKGTPKCASVKKKGRKSKSLSTKKHVTTDEILQKDDPNSLKVNSAVPPAYNFSLKIRIKSKEKNDCEDVIEEFTSPEVEKSADVQAKGMKSPPNTMLKYLVSQKSTSPSEIVTSKPKVNRDISDFFSPSKSKKEEISTNTEDMIKISSKLDSAKCIEIEESSKVKKNKKSPKLDVNKSVKKPRKKKLCILKKKEDADIPLHPVSNDNEVISESVVNQAKLTARKTKSSKKSLSLANNQTCGKSLDPSIELTEETTKPMEVSKLAVSHADAQQSGVAESIKDNFKKILSKSSFDDLSASCSVRPASLFSKKRKRDEKDDIDSAGDLTSEDSPVKLKKRIGTTNQISCDSDDDSFTVSSLNKQKNLASIDSNEDSGVISNDSEIPKRNSLMKYFSKVSKEESLAKSEKIELKVQALIHSPPTTPSKKVKRRSVNSLPGGAASLNKRKGNLKSKLKENVNAIEVIDTDEIKPILTGEKQDIECCGNGQPQRAKNAVRALPTDSKSGASLKTTKRLSSRGKEKQVTNSTQPSKKSVKSTKDVNAEVEEETKAASTLLPQSSCTLKVSFPTLQIPSTQGTLLEEESDDEEIFLSQSKKKRKIETLPVVEDQKSPDIIFEKKVGKSESIKVAPLFTRKADSQARQLFLQSGVPDQVKRVLETQPSFEEQEAEIFPKHSHIQQKNTKDWVWKLSEVELPLRDKCNQEITKIAGTFSFEDLTGYCNIKGQVDRIVAASCKGPEMRPVFRLPVDAVKPILYRIRQESPNFMVAKTYQALQDKCREDEFLKAGALSALSEVQRPKRKSSNRKSISCTSVSGATSYRCPVWTEKYKPSCSNDIVGNSQSVSQLKRWLEAWRKASEDACKLGKEETKLKRKKKDFIDDDDDFVVSDNSSDIGLSNLPVGVAVLYGPNGSGKTSAVYALSKDLGFKVLEVNASEKRNGKFVLSKLSEATQSHQVQQSNSAEQAFSALFGNSSASVKNKKQKHHKLKRIDSDEDKSKRMGLILFEDVDIVFEEEDEGFLSAISNLISTSKRPVILTTTDPESSLINRFMISSNLLLEFSCPSNLQCTWLQIVSLVEGIYVAPETVKDLVFLCKGDFRRALLQMQLWVMSGGNNLSLPPMVLHQSSLKPKKVKGSKRNGIGDIGDLEDEVDYDTPCIPANPDCIASLLGKNDFDDGPITENDEGPPCVKVTFPLNLGLFWWNIPPLLSLRQVEHAQLPALEENPAASESKGMLDDSFIASFCTDDGSTNDSATNEDVNVACSQGSNNIKSIESQDPEKFTGTCSSMSIDNTSSKNICSQQEMFTLAYQMIILSSIDIISVSSGLSSPSDVEPVSRFSQPLLKDSLALVKEDVEGPNFVFKSVSEDICHWLAEQSINRTRTSLCCNLQDVHSLYSNCLPNEAEYKWRYLHAKIEEEIVNVVPLSVALERQALATDYLPILRTICRLEKKRSIINLKRHNRFYHYLKSLGTNLTDGMLELLCRTMCDL